MTSQAEAQKKIHGFKPIQLYSNELELCELKLLDAKKQHLNHPPHGLLLQVILEAVPLRSLQGPPEQQEQKSNLGC